MGKGHIRTRARKALSRARPPESPRGDNAYRLLARVRKALADQRAGGPVFEPNAEERRVVEWLAFESGADMEMDRDPRYARAFEMVARKRAVLDAIWDPGSLAPDLEYPLDTGEVVTLLQKAGLDVDQNAVRRLADSFGVPRLGGGDRRTFFARHVLEIASAVLLDVNPTVVADLRRHLTLTLNDKELVLATMFPEVPSEQVALLTRSGPALARRRSA